MSNYQGHQSNGSGLQNHSIGGIYPYIIGYKPFTKEYYLMFSSGEILAYHANYNETYSHARIILDYYERNKSVLGTLSQYNDYLLNIKASLNLRRAQGFK